MMLLHPETFLAAIPCRHIDRILCSTISRSEDALHENCAMDAHLLRPALEVGLGEPQHLALSLPVDRQVVDAREELPIEMSWLPTVEDSGRDIRCEMCQAELICPLLSGPKLMIFWTTKEI
ncbi:MAG: hypothetical protein ACOY4C_14090 [Pseudomonadota bacterium]